MNYEQKYKEALERARSLHKDALINSNSARAKHCELIFPELKESEDEKIRKQIISFLKEFEYDHYRCLDFSSWIAWLEKQGGQNPNEWHREEEQNLNVCLGYIPDEFLRRWLKDVIHAKYDKSADKVEPKFKVGDWIIFNGLILYINEVVQGYYRTISKGGITNSYDWDIDNTARLWTIEDAKDGDVLVSISNQPFIYNGKYTESVVGAHIGINFDGVGLFATKTDNWTMTKGVKPATKEQRDYLFQRIKEDGYKLDADKKNIKRIKKVIRYESKN